MGTRRWVLIAVLSGFLAACSSPPRAHPQGVHPEQRPVGSSQADVLVLRSRAGVTAVAPSTRSVLFSGSAFPARADWSEVFTATRASRDTVVTRSQLGTGTPVTSFRVPGHLSIRVVSGEGNRIALMDTLPPGRTSWTPEPRAFTDMLVADSWEGKVLKRFHLKGNFEPEAFSTDDGSLFMIRYLPASAPVGYRVVRLDLGDGDVYPAVGRRKVPVETMTGTRLHQVASPDGTRLYTLYSSQPPEYAKGYEPAQAGSDRPVAFIHTLSLDGGWAICVGLPKALWGGEPSRQALAVSPDGGMLYVTDAARGVVSILQTDEMRVIRTNKVHFGSPGGGETSATVDPDGHSLLVATGSTIAVFDTSSLRAVATWRMEDRVTGLGFSPDGLRLYVAMPEGIEMLDPRSGEQGAMIPMRWVLGIEAVGTQTVDP